MKYEVTEQESKTKMLTTVHFFSRKTEKNLNFFRKFFMYFPLQLYHSNALPKLNQQQEIARENLHLSIQKRIKLGLVWSENFFTQAMVPMHGFGCHRKNDFIFHELKADTLVDSMVLITNIELRALETLLLVESFSVHYKRNFHFWAPIR